MAYPWSKPRWHDTDARRRCDMQKALPLSAQAGYARRKPSKHHVLMRFRSWPQRDSGWCVSLVGAATSIIFVSSLAGVATSIIFVATKVLSRQNTFFVATNTWEQVSFFLSRQVSFVVTDKHVTRKTFIMSRQIHRDKSFVAARLLSRQKLYLWQLPPMIQFPPMNDMFGTTKICSGKRRLLSWLCRVFCRVCPDKNNTVVAAPASDRCGA